MQIYCRVSRELDAVKQEASLLRDQMTMVKHDIEKVSFALKTRKKTLDGWFVYKNVSGKQRLL